MKVMFLSFKMLLRQVARDGMLLAACIGPLLAACFFRFLIPALEQFLCAYFHMPQIIAPYYLLIDLFLSMITPYMFCFASAMVLLTEFDEHIAGYLAVTPIGKAGYLLSRLILPAAMAFMASLALVTGFSLTPWRLLYAAAVCFLSTLICLNIALMLFAFSGNRVEGMAIAKAAGLILLGLPVPFVFSESIQFFFAPLPSFWLAKFAAGQNGWHLAAGLVVSAAWLLGLKGILMRKLAAG